MGEEDFPFDPTTVVLGVLGVTLTYGAVTLVGPILRPRIVSYPWPKAAISQATAKRDKGMTVILAGSYNPPHKGHLEMLLYLAERYGHVIAVVGKNPNKSYDVTPEERQDMIRKMLQPTGVANVDVQVVEGYIWRFGKREGANLFVRGIRSWDKDGADERSLQILNTWGPLLLGPVWPLPTMYLEGKPEYNHISSSLIRDQIKTQSGVEWLSKLVPQAIVSDVRRLYGKPS